MPTLYSHIKQPFKGLPWEILKVFGVRPGPYTVFPPGPTAHLSTFSPREQRASLPLCPACVTAFCDGNWPTPLSFWGSTETLSLQSWLWRNAEALTDASFKITKIMRRRAVDWDVRDTELWCFCPASLGCALFPIPGQLINVLWWVVSFKVTQNLTSSKALAFKDQ